MLADFTSAYCAVLHNLYGISFPVADPEFPAVWDWPSTFGVTPEQESAAWKVIKSTAFWQALPHLKESEMAIMWLNRARRMGHDIYFITNRPGTHAKAQSEEWLWTRGYLTPTVLISQDKGFLAAGLNLDVFIDDKPSNCLDVLSARGTKTRIYLRETPYNREFAGRDRLAHVPTILEMLENELGDLRPRSRRTAVGSAVD